MSDRLVKGVFQSDTEACRALEVLRHNFQTQRISVFGNEEEELYKLTLSSRKHSAIRNTLAFGIIGLAVGTLTGLWLTPVTAASAAVMPMIGSLVGAVTGATLGVVIGLMFELNQPEREADPFPARLSKGRVAVVVRTQGRFEHRMAESILDEYRANDIFTISIAEKTISN